MTKTTIQSAMDGAGQSDGVGGGDQSPKSRKLSLLNGPFNQLQIVSPRIDTKPVLAQRKASQQSSNSSQMQLQLLQNMKKRKVNN